MMFPETSRMGEAPRARAVDDLDRTRGVDDDAIRALLIRLARVHPSGGKVIERAAILAAGADLAAVMGWIAAHAGQPEATTAAKSKGGLHGSRIEAARTPLRYVLPADALD
jgi:hypothetical protein